MKNPVILSMLGAVLFGFVHGHCHKYEQEYYQELGCKPLQTSPEGCITSFDCSSLKNRSQQQCHYQGRGYDHGQMLDTAGDSATSCLAECRCGGALKSSEKQQPVFSCVSIECPELFNGPPPEGCYRTYEHDKCCYIKEICEDEASQKTAKPKCEYKGESFQEGQKFYPDEEPCLQCICLPGFNGSLVEPFCQKVQCNLELLEGDNIAQGCVPVYYGESGCCPIDWRCPEETDFIVKSATEDGKGAPNTDEKCQFGKLSMSVGDTLSPSLERDNTECICRVPPHPICIQKKYPVD